MFTDSEQRQAKTADCFSAMVIRFMMIGAAISQLFNVLTAFDLSDTSPAERFCGRCYRKGLERRRKAIDAVFLLLFNQHNHCEKSHIAGLKDAACLTHTRRENDQ